MKINRNRPRASWSMLRIGHITLSMSIAMAVGLGVGLVALALDASFLSPPPVMLGTIADARILLGAVISGLITVAVFGLWMRTVVVGMMAAHFSPRTLLIFLDDSFQRNLLAFMSAGIVVVIVILLRMSTEEQAAAPLLSIILVVVIALAAMAGVLLAIQHATRSLSLPELINRLAENALNVLDRHPAARLKLSKVPPPMAPTQAVLSQGTGWITAIDIDRMREALPVGGVIHLRCRVGVFVTPRHPIALVSLTEDGGQTDLDAVAKAVSLARIRSTEKDLAFAVSQLVDVGTYALQERWDTATTHEVMVHLGDVLAEIVDRGLPPLHDKDADGRCIYDETGWEAVDLVRQCVERLRGPAASDPEIALHLMQMLHLIRQVAEDRMSTDVISEVELQVELILALAKNSGMLTHDRQRLEREAKIVFK